MATNDFIMTIDSEEETPPLQGKRKLAHEDIGLNPEFIFDVSSSSIVGADNDLIDVIQTGSKPVGNVSIVMECKLMRMKKQPISVDDIIARRRHAKKRKREVEEETEEAAEEAAEADGGTTDEEDSTVGFSATDGEVEEDPLATSTEEEAAVEDEWSDNEGDFSDAGSSSSEDTQPETQAALDKQAAFFDSEIRATEAHSSFLTLNLSRPILKAITTLGYQKPTPIQAAAIPVALLGKDVVGGAVTGSGKTAAFVIPMLERLLYRDKSRMAAATRCLVLVPTRELAVQCFQVCSKLAMHTDIKICLAIGERSLKSS